MTETDATAAAESGGLPTEAAAPSALPAAAVLAPHLPVIAVLAFYIARAWDRRWIADDAFIHLRVVDNVLAGHGPVYNVGERVEAATSFLWVWLSALVAWLSPAGPELTLIVVSVLLAAGGLALAYVAQVRWVPSLRHGPHLIAPVAAMVVTPLAVVWDFTTSGLDTALVIAWLGAAWAALLAIRRTDDWRPGWAWFVLGLGPVVRPDLVVVAAVLLVGALLITGGAPGGRWRVVVLAGLVPVAVQVFRMGYYGVLVPNTVITKGVDVTRWELGWLFFRDFAATYWLIVPLGLLVLLVRPARFASSRRSSRGTRIHLVLDVDWASVAMVAAGVVHGLLVIRGGGGFMHGRLLLPALLAIVLPWSAVRLEGLRLAAAGVLAVWFVLAAGLFRTSYDVFKDPGDPIIANERGFYVIGSGQRNPMVVDDYTTLGPWYEWGRVAAQEAAAGSRSLVLTGPTQVVVVPDASPDGVVLRFTNIGITGVVAGPDVLIDDALGLADPIAARTESVVGRPGHEKLLPAEWTVAEHVDPDSVAEVVRRTAGTEVAVDPEGVDAATRALACPAVAELVDAVEGPMTLQRFLRNVVRSPQLTFLEIPRDPMEAQNC